MGLFRRNRKHGRPVEYGAQVYIPFHERLEGTDQHNYLLPMPWITDNYMTYWYGNRIPPTTFYTQTSGPGGPSGPTHRYLIRGKQQDTSLPQLKASGFGQQLGQLDTASMLARWKQSFINATGQYGERG